ncbi:MAG TPA: hypothetical protein VMT58_09565, partial [Candidatus Binataceae bacterium]|nr:hypothetical protein [Candidatus Binataceae bacterium]
MKLRRLAVAPLAALAAGIAILPCAVTSHAATDGAARSASVATAKPAVVRVPILIYHRIATTADNEMTVTTRTFDAQLRYLHDNDYTILPLQKLIDYLRGTSLPPPARSVVITADDGNESIFTEMRPRAEKWKFPVTLFI